MKNLVRILILSIATTSFAQAREDAPMIVQLGFATTVAPTAILLSPFLPTILTFSADQTWKKEIIAAQEDCAYFVATEGEIKTARVEQIIQAVREHANIAELSDVEVAQLILAVGPELELK